MVEMFKPIHTGQYKTDRQRIRYLDRFRRPHRLSGLSPSESLLGLSYQTRIFMSEFDKYAGLFAGQGDFDIPSNYTFVSTQELEPVKYSKNSISPKKRIAGVYPR